MSAPADGACFYWSVLLLTTHDTLDDIDASTNLREPRPMRGMSGESRRLMGNMRELRRQAVAWIQKHLTVLYDDPALTRTFPQYVAGYSTPPAPTGTWRAAGNGSPSNRAVASTLRP